MSDLLPVLNANGRRNVAMGFLIRRLPEPPDGIRLSTLEAAVLRDFEPCCHESYSHGLAKSLTAWHRYKDFQHFAMKLQTSGYVVIKNGDETASRKTVTPDSLVYRGRNATHCIPKSGAVARYLDRYDINPLDLLASI
jgi:hypothetical protein